MDVILNPRVFDISRRKLRRVARGILKQMVLSI
jgi:hypothetical protein